MTCDDPRLIELKAKFKTLSPFEQRIILAGADGLAKKSLSREAFNARIADLAQRHRNGEVIDEAEVEALRAPNPEATAEASQ